MDLGIPGAYEVFNPSFEWIRGESLDTLLIHLPGFKKEQLKVHMDSAGNLRISGAQLLGGRPGLWLWKEFQVPANCSVNNVRAKFENDTLHVSFPKLVITGDDSIGPPPKAPKLAAAAAAGASKEKIPEIKMSDDGKKAWTRRAELEPGGEGVEVVIRQDGRRELLLNVAVASVVLLGLGLYVTYKLSKGRTR